MDPDDPRRVSSVRIGSSHGARVILAGHSHGTALGLTFTSKHQPPRLVPIAGRGATFFALKGSPRKRRYWDGLVARAKNSTVLIVWLGNQHLVRFLLAQGPSFDFHLAQHPDQPHLSGAAIVPEALVRSVIGEPIQPLRGILRRLKARRGCTPVVLGTPPPKGNDERLHKLLGREIDRYLGADAAGIDLDAISLTDRQVRRKLWLVLQDLLEDAAKDAGCAFAPVPAQSMDASGFLKEEYWREDVSHANSLYGDLFWQELTGTVVAAR